jgi:hypothetical protein
MFPRATGEANLRKNDRFDGNLKRDSASRTIRPKKQVGHMGCAAAAWVKQSGRAPMNQALEQRRTALTSA